MEEYVILGEDEGEDFQGVKELASGLREYHNKRGNLCGEEDSLEKNLLKTGRETEYL